MSPSSATARARLKAGASVHARPGAGALFFPLLFTLLGGCASMVPQTMALRSAWPEGVALRTDIPEVPFFAQDDYQCGPAALATTLVHSGVQITPEELVSEVYLPARRGSLQAEMLAAPRRHDRVSYRLSPVFDDLLREVAAGNPVLVLQDTGPGLITNWHYAVVVGYDYPAGELYLRSGTTKRQAIPFTIFEYTWKKSDYWAMVTLPAGRVPATATEAGYLTAVSSMARVSTTASARLAYTALLVRWPGNEIASIALANSHYAAGELAQAESVLRAAAEQHPHSVPLMNNLAQTLSDLGRNEEALILAARAASEASGPFAASARETRSMILQRLGTPR